MPLTWLISGSVVWWFYDRQIALTSIPITVLLRSAETLIDLRIRLKSAWLLFRQKALFYACFSNAKQFKKKLAKSLKNKPVAEILPYQSGLSFIRIGFEAKDYSKANFCRFFLNIKLILFDERKRLRIQYFEKNSKYWT
jgi:hypothetical protein